MRFTTLSSATPLMFALAVLAPSTASADYTVRCASDDHRHRTCRLSEPGYVTVERQVSGAKCVQGRTWDFDRREIWVDGGCEADFRVETHGWSRSGSYSNSYTYSGSSGSSGSSGKSNAAAVAVGAVAAVAILGALVNNSNHQDDYKYRDENYYGPRHTSYVPGWMVGTFRGYNPMYGADVQMTVQPDGRVTADANGQVVNGYINSEELHVGPYIFNIDKTYEGFVTSQKGDRHNEVRYRKVR